MAFTEWSIDDVKLGNAITAVGKFEWSLSARVFLW